MTLSPAVTRGLTNRIDGLTREVAKLRRPALGGRTPGDGEERAAVLAEAAIASARLAMDGQITTIEALEALRGYTHYLDANVSVSRFLGI